MQTPNSPEQSVQMVPGTGLYPPQTIIVQTRGGLLGRILAWIGWIGFLGSLALLIFQSISLSKYFDTTDGIEERYHSLAKHGQNKVAIISIEGTILDGEGFVKKQIDRVRQDKDVKAVVVRVASPGGTITGSDYIYHHLKRLREERQIPLVVSMGSMAASGGYYVSMAVGDQPQSIYAEPTTTTGSIGVIIPHYDFSGLLERFDVKDDSIVSHPRKQMLSMTRPISEEDRAVLQAYLDEAFVRFKEIVKEGRPAFAKDSAALDRLATGQIFTAQQALDSGLVDEIGFVEDAIDRAMELAQLDKATTRVVRYRRLGSLFNLPFLARADAPQMDLAAFFDLNTPQAYYLATTLPPLLKQRAAE